MGQAGYKTSELNSCSVRILLTCVCLTQCEKTLSLSMPLIAPQIVKKLYVHVSVHARVCVYDLYSVYACGKVVSIPQQRLTFGVLSIVLHLMF